MRTTSLLRVVLVLGVVPGASGCVGYAIGYAIDAGNKQVVDPSRPSLPEIPRGKSVKVVLKNGHKLSGTYKGVEPLAADDYAQLYATSRDALVTGMPGLPLLGDTVDLLLQTGEAVEVEFLGCDWDGLAIRRSSAAEAEKLNALTVRDVQV
jgi:hypothetical protein